MATLIISQAAVDLIIFSEISSEANYIKNLARPEFPGLNSGITVGIGYDLGYSTLSQITADWGKLVDGRTINAMLSVAGLKGAAAKAMLATVKPLISIPFLPAKTVLTKRMLPKAARETYNAFPGVENLHPSAAGALVSLVFNRGAATTGPRREEMAAIKKLVPIRDYEGIAAQILSMKRLWDGISEDGQEKRVQGLLTRRDAEARLVSSTDGLLTIDF